MQWNGEQIPYQVALRIGWNLPMDVVGAGVYGGVIKRDAKGKIVVGDEWPENNVAPPAHNPVHSRGPYLDFSKFTPESRGYARICTLVMDGRADEMDALLSGLDETDRRKLANLVMTGGARPLHMCGMGRAEDRTKSIQVLLNHGADVNAKDNYEYTPIDRLASNSCPGKALLQSHGGLRGRQLPRGCPDWASDEFDYAGPGEDPSESDKLYAGA